MCAKKQRQIKNSLKKARIINREPAAQANPERVRGRQRSGLIASMLLFLAGTLLIAGCWDRREVNDIALVVAMAIDKEDDGMIRFSIQVPIVSQLGGPSGEGGGGGGGRFYVDSAVARTLREANAIMQSRLPRHVYYAHHRVVVIGEELARSGIRDVLDIVSRFPENRLTAYIALARGKGADLLMAQPQFELFSGEAIRELVKEVAIPVNLKDLAQRISTPGLDAFLPMFTTVKTNPVTKSKELELTGIGIFRGDKLIEVEGLSALTCLKGFQPGFLPYTMVLNLNQTDHVSFDVFEGHSRIEPVRRPGHFHFHIKVNAYAIITENFSPLNVGDMVVMRDLEKKLNEKLSRQIKNLVKSMKENRADTLGLGISVARHFPKAWQEQYKDRWGEEELPRITVDVTCTIKLVQSGQTTTNIMEEGSK